MPIVIREFREEDWPQAATIWSLSFYGGEPLERDGRLFRHPGSRAFVAEDEDGIAGALILFPMPVTCRGALMPCGGVSVVGVAPEHRRQGIGSAMLHWLAGYMRREGMVLSALHGAHESYYRRFGWAVGGRRMEIVCPRQRLPHLETDLPVRRLTLDDWDELQPAYDAFAARYSGMVARTKHIDSRVHIRQGAQPVVYAVGDPVDAYAIVRLERGGMERDLPEQTVAEVVWSTPHGYRAILGSLATLCFNSSALRWCEPGDGPFLTQFIDRGMEARRMHTPMYRVLDVAAALRALRPEGGGSLVLEVEDELLAANDGPWLIEWGGGEVAVGPAPARAAGLRMPIGALTQALLGEPSLDEVVRAGMVEVHDPSALAAARRQLPPFPTHCLDFF